MALALLQAACYRPRVAGSTEWTEGVDVGTARPGADDVASRRGEGRASSAADRRCFLGWTRPLPESAADWFIDRHAEDTREIDASGEVWVFPGARAGREFLRRLHDRAESSGRPLIPPMVITPGRLGEVVSDRSDGPPPATDLEVRSAWAMELALATEPLQASLLGSARTLKPEEAWAMASRFAKAIAEVRGEGFEPAEIVAMSSEAESSRWAAIVELDRRVSARLESCGLTDPVVVRREAAEHGSIRPLRVVTAGVLEWSGWQRRILDRAEATVLVAAPESSREQFDACGAVVVDRWIGRASPVPETSVLPVASPQDAAAAMLERIEGWSPGRSTAAITVGLADPSLADPAARAARSAGLSLHVAEGDPLAASAPGRLIDAFASLLREPTADRGASFLRHPHVAAWVARSVGLAREIRDALPSAIATVLEERMPRSFADLVAASAMPIDPARFGSVKAVDREREREALRQALGPVEAVFAAWTLDRDRGASWAQRLAAWLAEVGEAIADDIAQDDASGELRRRLIDDHRSVGEILREFAAIPSPIDPELEGAVWIARLLERLDEARESPPADPQAIEALGWLELAADPAPHLVLVGMHDEATPGSAAVDPLLPERLRERLGLGSARRREARDAAILAMLAARCEALEVIVPLKDHEGKVLLPSRLLLHGDGVASADRVLRFTTPVAVPRRTVFAATSGFRVPTPDPGRPLPTKLSVTALRLYLADPRRFDLRYVERLEEVGEAAGELDPLRFGTLAHAVLERFGGDPTMQGERDALRLCDRLDALLDEVASEAFGHGPRASIAVQIRNLRRRLHRFAIAEAASRTQGWETRHVELWLDASLEIGPSEAPQPFSGRIDRVDRHRETGRLRVLDYKTGDEAADPEGSHLVGKGDRRRWIDLQLPIYRHLLARQLRVPETSIEVGYVRLARSSSAPIFRTIEHWSDEVFGEAIEKAREVVRSIRDRRFPQAEPPARPDAFSYLLHEPVIAIEADGAREA